MQLTQDEEVLPGLFVAWMGPKRFTSGITLGSFRQIYFVAITQYALQTNKQLYNEDFEAKPRIRSMSSGICPTACVAEFKSTSESLSVV